MLENPFVFHLITQLLAPFATVVLLFREPQNHSKNTWIAHVENKQKNTEVSEARASVELLLCLFCRWEKTWRGHFPFHHPLKQACLSHGHLLSTQRMTSALCWVSFHWRVFEEQNKNHRIIWNECLEVSQLHPQSQQWTDNPAFYCCQKKCDKHVLTYCYTAFCTFLKLCMWFSFMYFKIQCILLPGFSVEFP